MKILEVDKETYKVFGDTLTVNEKLKPAVYSVKFSDMAGFSLKKREPLTVTEKLYGDHEKKVNKIIRSFEAFNRSMGVIFSGDKGTGKSIAARLLCEKMVARKGIPVIMADENYPGIASFIDSIKQECVIFFDEFEKNFKLESGRGDKNNSSQDKLLSLFDGTSQVKQLYLITCNNIGQLSNFMLNRPGRFHYHIRWDYPSVDETRKYLEDNVKAEYREQIDEVVSFSTRARLSYDCLRAIVFELNLGETFKEVIDDLNIKNLGNDRYTIYIRFKNGKVINGWECIDLFNSREKVFNICAAGGTEYIIKFAPAKTRYINGRITITDFEVKNCDEDHKNVTNDVVEAWLERRGSSNYTFNLSR